MKIRNYKLKIGNSGELATLAVLILGGITILGTLFASRLAQEGPRSQSQAQCVSQCAICNPANDTSCNPYEDTTCQVVTLCDGRGKWCWQPDDSCKNRSQPTSTPAVTQPPQTTQPPQPTQPPSGACPGEWECVISGQPVICSDGSQTRANFNNYWCDGEPRWKWEAAGNTNRCGGSASQARPANKPYPQSCYTPTTGPTQPLGTVAPTQPAGAGTCTVSISDTLYSGFCVHQKLCPGGIATGDQNNFGCGTRLGCCLETSAITCSSGFSGSCVTSSACQHDNILPEIPNNYGCGGLVCCVPTPIITITPTPRPSIQPTATGIPTPPITRAPGQQGCYSVINNTYSTGDACGRHVFGPVGITVTSCGLWYKCINNHWEEQSTLSSTCGSPNDSPLCGNVVSPTPSLHPSAVPTPQPTSSQRTLCPQPPEGIGCKDSGKHCDYEDGIITNDYRCADSTQVCCVPKPDPCQLKANGFYTIDGKCIQCKSRQSYDLNLSCVTSECLNKLKNTYVEKFDGLARSCFMCTGEYGEFYGYKAVCDPNQELIALGGSGAVVGSENVDFLKVINLVLEGKFPDAFMELFKRFLTRTPSLQKEPCDPRLGTRPGGCSTDHLRITVRPQPTYTPTPTPVI